MSKHADMAAQSGIFLIYFKATSKVLGKSMDAVAVMTDGDIFDLVRARTVSSMTFRETTGTLS